MKLKIIMISVVILSIAVILYAQNPAPETEAGQYTADTLKDPFETWIIIPQIQVVPVEENVVLPPIQVQGVVCGGDFPQAIINDKLVKVNEIINDVTVISIEKEKIVLSYKKKLFDVLPPGKVAMQKLEGKTTTNPTDSSQGGK